jgi:hypothetical protein
VDFLNLLMDYISTIFILFFILILGALWLHFLKHRFRCVADGLFFVSSACVSLVVAGLPLRRLCFSSNI